MADPFIAEIRIVGFNFAPRGWAFCDGRLLPIAQNTALFSIIGTTFGGDGRTTTGLPDMRSRFPVHDGASTGPGLSSYRLGDKTGREQVALTTNNLPSHTHGNASLSAAANSGHGTEASPAGNYLAAADDGEKNYSNGTPDGTVAGLPSSVGNTGGGQSLGIMPPFLSMYYCIALTGTYPSRS